VAIPGACSVIFLASLVLIILFIIPCFSPFTSTFAENIYLAEIQASLSQPASYHARAVGPVRSQINPAADLDPTKRYFRLCNFAKRIVAPIIWKKISLSVSGIAVDVDRSRPAGPWFVAIEEFGQPVYQNALDGFVLEDATP